MDSIDRLGFNEAREVLSGSLRNCGYSPVTTKAKDVVYTTKWFGPQEYMQLRSND